MRVTTLVLGAILCTLLGSIVFTTSKPKDANANATAPPSAYTGAPGDVGTCVSCHTGTGTGNLVMGLADSPTEYIPSQTDTLVILISDPAPAQNRWGFEVTVLKNSDNTMAGTLTPHPSAGILTGSASAGGRTYVSHRSNGATAPFDPDDGTFWGISGLAGWLVEWTAPPPGTGPVTFYVSGISANGDEASGATDNTYTGTLILPEAGSTPVTTTTWGKIKKRYH